MKFILQHEVSWKDIEANPMQPFLIELSDPSRFSRELPVDYRPPTSNNPKTGLPSNVWVGCRASKTQYRHVNHLTSVSARIRWLKLVGPMGRHELKFFGRILDSWRCSNCGHRGPRRPWGGQCPHAKAMCGDAQLLPQIHWVIPGDPLPIRWVAEAEELGIRVHTEPPDIYELKEFRHLKEVTV